MSERVDLRIPINLPCRSNSPAPENPGRTAASVWITGAALISSPRRKRETMPRDSDRSVPFAAPMT